MKRVFLAIALTLGVMGANAQNVEQPGNGSRNFPSGHLSAGNVGGRL